MSVFNDRCLFLNSNKNELLSNTYKGEVDLNFMEFELKQCDNFLKLRRERIDKEKQKQPATEVLQKEATEQIESFKKRVTSAKAKTNESVHTLNERDIFINEVEDEIRSLSASLDSLSLRTEQCEKTACDLRLPMDTDVDQVICRTLNFRDTIREALGKFGINDFSSNIYQLSSIREEKKQLSELFFHKNAENEMFIKQQVEMTTASNEKKSHNVEVKCSLTNMETSLLEARNSHKEKQDILGGKLTLAKGRIAPMEKLVIKIDSKKKKLLCIIASSNENKNALNSLISQRDRARDTAQKKRNKKTQFAKDAMGHLEKQKSDSAAKCSEIQSRIAGIRAQAESFTEQYDLDCLRCKNFSELNVNRTKWEEIQQANETLEGQISEKKAQLCAIDANINEKTAAKGEDAIRLVAELTSKKAELASTHKLLNDKNSEFDKIEERLISIRNDVSVRESAIKADIEKCSSELMSKEKMLLRMKDMIVEKETLRKAAEVKRKNRELRKIKKEEKEAKMKENQRIQQMLKQESILREQRHLAELERDRMAENARIEEDKKKKLEAAELRRKEEEVEMELIRDMQRKREEALKAREMESIRKNQMRKELAHAIQMRKKGNDFQTNQNIGNVNGIPSREKRVEVPLPKRQRSNSGSTLATDDGTIDELDIFERANAKSKRIPPPLAFQDNRIRVTRQKTPIDYMDALNSSSSTPPSSFLDETLDFSFKAAVTSTPYTTKNRRSGSGAKPTENPTPTTTTARGRRRASNSKRARGRGRGKK